MSVTYEWIAEETDDYGDVLNVIHADSWSELQPMIDGQPVLVALVRNAGERNEQRSWAYMDDHGHLPAWFTDAMGDATARVPGRFRPNRRPAEPG